MPIPIRPADREKGYRGLGDVSLTSTQVKIKVVANGEEFKFNRSDLDFTIPSTATGKMFVSISAQGDRLYSLRPMTGVHTSKFVGFQMRRGEKEPTPRLERGGPRRNPKTGQMFESRDRHTFIARFEIVAGKYKGLEIPIFLEYLFAQSDDGEIVSIPDPTFKAASQLHDFLLYTGILDSVTIPYSPNVLPALQKVILKYGKEVDITLSKGNPVEGCFSDASNLERPARRKAAKKSKK